MSNFDFNADRFCCSARGAQFRKNLLAREAAAWGQFAQQPLVNPITQPLTNYSDQNVMIGIAQPEPYVMTAIGRWDVPCGRMPGGIYANVLPCRRV